MASYSPPTPRAPAVSPDVQTCPAFGASRAAPHLGLRGPPPHADTAPTEPPRACAWGAAEGEVSGLAGVLEWIYRGSEVGPKPLYTPSTTVWAQRMAGRAVSGAVAPAPRPHPLARARHVEEPDRTALALK